MLLSLTNTNLTASVLTTGIGPLCSSGLVKDKIVKDKMPQFELCYSFRITVFLPFEFGGSDWSKVVFAFVVAFVN